MWSNTWKSKNNVNRGYIYTVTLILAADIDVLGIEIIMFCKAVIKSWLKQLATGQS